MNFIQRIWQTKKVKKARKFSEKTLKNISEKVEDVMKIVKKKALEVRKKFKVSKKIKSAENKINSVLKNTGNKIESLLDEKISFNDFEKIEIRVGEILEVEKIEKSDKLLKLKVDLGEKKTRQIISGISKFYKNPEKELVGKQAMFVSNLAPRKIFGYESDGMIFAVNSGKKFSILSPLLKIKNGTLAG
jgi:methionine--tRNA ligase beta chain